MPRDRQRRWRERPEPTEGPATAPSTPDPPAYRLYSEYSLYLGTFLGSLPAAGVFLISNARAIADPEGPRQAAVFASLSTLLLLAALFLEPPSWEVHQSIYQATQVGAVWAYLRYQQGASIAAHKRAGGEFFSTWRAAGISLLIGLLFFAVIWGLIVIGDSAAA